MVENALLVFVTDFKSDPAAFDAANVRDVDRQSAAEL
jgi:hypothetical protein